MEMQVTTDLAAIDDLKENRASNGYILPIPDKFRREVFSDLKPEKTYTPATSRYVQEGNSTFWNRPMHVYLYPVTEKNKPTSVSYNHQSIENTIGNVSLGLNNITISSGDTQIGILEHPNAALTALRTKFHLGIEAQRSGTISLPTNSLCDQPYIDALCGNLKVLDDNPDFISVSHPIAFQFGGGYIVLEPDIGTKKLIVDHQISHPKIPALGTQRVCTEITPELFAFIARARTPAYGYKTSLLTLMPKCILTNILRTSLNMENVLVAGKKGLINAKTDFDHAGVNYEFIFHELIDKIGWLHYIEDHFGGHFVGKATFYRTGHKHEIAVAKAICDAELLPHDSKQRELAVDTKKLNGTRKKAAAMHS